MTPTTDGCTSSNRAFALTEFTLLYVIVSPNTNPFHASLFPLPMFSADVRSGYSENAWVNVTHLITYHRYLRFLPNGVVLSLLANEDQSPQDVVHYLKPGLKMKVCLFFRITIDSCQLYGGTDPPLAGLLNWHLDTGSFHLNRPCPLSHRSLKTTSPTAPTCTSRPTALPTSKPPCTQPAATPAAGHATLQL